MSDQAVGWAFRDRRWLDAALSGDGLEFQRLEFLGDAVVDAVLLPWLYRWSTGTVAVLSGARQQLTSDSTLGHLALLSGLHGQLPPHLQQTTERGGDLIEALVGAAFVDGGWPAATTACQTVFGGWLAEPSGVAESAARIDTAVSPEGTEWRWRCSVWLSGETDPVGEAGSEHDPLLAEIKAVSTGLLHLGRARPSVWVEVSDELRAEMVAGPTHPHAARIQELRALLAAFDGVWFVPTDRLDTTLDPWSPDLEHDGELTDFETITGHDLMRPALERLALHPGPEHRRLAFVGAGILKSAAAERAYRESPSRSEAELTSAIHAELSLERLYRAMFAAGLVDLLFPGVRPANPVMVLRAALGAVAVDAGPEPAMALASRWLDAVRVADVDIHGLCAIDCRFVPTPAGHQGVEILLSTRTSQASWQLEDQGVDRRTLAIEGICAAIDSLEARHDAQPLLLSAPPGVVGAIDGSRKLTRFPETAASVARLLARIDQRGLRVLWSGPVNGATPLT